MFFNFIRFTKTSYRILKSIRPQRLMEALTGSLLCLLILTGFSSSHFPENAGNDHEKKWVGTWTTAPQLVEPHNMPPEPGLSNKTLRQIVRVSIGGDSLRIKLSNNRHPELFIVAGRFILMAG